MDLNKIIIDTKRLRLLPITPDYTQVIYNNFTPDIAEYMYPQPTGKVEDTKRFILESMKGLKNGTNLQLVITKKQSNEFLGCVGLHNVDSVTPELGIWVKRSAHGCGYGLEAIEGVMNWAREEIDFEHFKYPVDRNNKRSSRIPIRNGGFVKKEYTLKNSVGTELDIVEYWIKK